MDLEEVYWIWKEKNWIWKDYKDLKKYNRKVGIIMDLEGLYRI